MDRADASDRLALKFTRVMNATPSRFGVLSDVASASVISGTVLVLALFFLRGAADSSRNLALGLAFVPLAASLVASAALARSREKVVSWLASLPFPVDNMNAVLAGTSDTIEVAFAEGAVLPKRAELAPKLESVSEDVFLLAERSEDRTLEIKLGVVDSKRLPLVTNHRRYRRLVDLVERVLIPLGQTAPIQGVRLL
jgi:hypothetical protein